MVSILMSASDRIGLSNTSNYNNNSPISSSNSRKRRRRSLPSSLERKVSLQELICEEKSTKRKKKDEQKQQSLDALAMYFKQIDNEELKITSQKDAEVEIQEKTATQPKTLRRIVRRRRMSEDPRLLREYRLYCEATDGIVEPVPIEEFAASIEPELKPGMYEGILDVHTQ